MNSTEEWIAKNRNDPRTTGDLIGAARRAFAAVGDNERAYDSIVGILHCRADDQVLAAARNLARSDSAMDRNIAADILAQIHVGNPDFRKRAGDILEEMSLSESMPDVLIALGYAFGHNGNPRAVSFVEKLAKSTDPDFRLAAAYALPFLRDDNPGEIVPILIQLCEDTDSRVRDWATFALGNQLDTDRPEIRDALARRLFDSCDDAQGEAMVALAKRGDARMIEFFLNFLESGKNPGSLMEDAAEEILLRAKENRGDAWGAAAQRMAALSSGKLVG
jgi:HEAT repeat protein